MTGDSSRPTPPTRRSGGRTARVRARVLDAVRAQLVEEGFDALTVDAVASRAGVHRTTVYRRWRDVGGLLADVLQVASDDGWQPRDVGELEGDLVALNDDVLAALTAEPPVTSALIAASFRSDEAARALRSFWEDRYGRCEAIVARAVRRGEVPAATDARALLVAATAPLYHQVVLLRVPPDAGLPRWAARSAARAALAGVFAGPEPVTGG